MGQFDVYDTGQAVVASLLVGGGDVAKAADMAKASDATSVLGKTSIFARTLTTEALENGKNLLTLPSRAFDNISGKLSDLRTAFSQGSGFSYAFASASDGRSVLSLTGKNADEVQMNFSKTTNEADGTVEKAQQDLQNALDKAPKAEYLPGKTPENILDTPKGKREPAEDYLSSEYIDAHKALFEDGGTAFANNSNNLTTYGQFGRNDGAFVFPKEYAQKMINASGGNPQELEKLLGLDKGSLGNSPIRIDVSTENMQNLRIPSGNEDGINSLWRPGGGTYPGGVPEGVIDPVDPDKLTVSSIFGGN